MADAHSTLIGKTPRFVPGVRANALVPTFSPLLVDKFWRGVDRSAGPDGCWLWTRQLDQAGYGRFRPSLGIYISAHRTAWILTYGPVDPALVFDHLCRRPACVNPAHLELVTWEENNRRGFSGSAVNKRKVACCRGHAFTAENTYISANRRHRRCRTCLLAWRRSRAETRAMASHASRGARATGQP